jgi:hypothetical protein
VSAASKEPEAWQAKHAKLQKDYERDAIRLRCAPLGFERTRAVRAGVGCDIWRCRLGSHIGFVYHA